TTNQSMLNKIEEGLSQWTINSIEDPLQISKQAFQDVMIRTSGVEFVFEGQVPFGLFEKTFSRMPREYENRTFNRAFVPFNNPEKFYFYDSVNHMFYETDIEGMTPEDVDAFAFNEEVSYMPVEAVQVKNQHIYLPADPMEISHKDYMIERLPNSLFVNFFFADTSEVDVRRSDNVTRYLDYVSEMRINEDNNILTYRKQQSSSQSVDLSQRLDQAFN